METKKQRNDGKLGISSRLSATPYPAKWGKKKIMGALTWYRKPIRGSLSGMAKQLGIVGLKNY